MGKREGKITVKLGTAKRLTSRGMCRQGGCLRSERTCEGGGVTKRGVAENCPTSWGGKRGRNRPIQLEKLK